MHPSPWPGHRTSAPAVRSGYASLWRLEPKIDLASRKVIGLEMRLGHRPIRDIMLVATRDRGPGILRAASMTILVEAIDLARGLRSSDIRVELAVDMPPSCIDGNLTRTLARFISRYQLSPKQLRLEISERSSSIELLQAAESLHRLHELGVAISLDQFGSGLLGRSEIDKLPVDELKVDSSILPRAGTSPSPLPPIQDLADWGHCLGFDVVAEAVNDVRLLDLVTEVGFDAAQGSAIAAAVPADRIHVAMRQTAIHPAARNIKRRLSLDRRIDLDPIQPIRGRR